MSFGMLMPNRNTQSNLQGGFSSGGTTTINGNTYVSNLTITTRIGNTPNTYKAANSIEFIGEYVDNGNEEYEAFIVNQTNPDPNPTTGTVSSSSGDGYRYGFNGKENDKDISEGDLDFGARIYDSRLGRWLALDPLMKKYPNESNYAYVADNPIFYKDADGKDKIVTITLIGKNQKIYQSTVTDKDIFLYVKHETLGTFNPNKFYKASQYVNVVIDMSGDKIKTTITVSGPLELKEISRGDYYINKLIELIGGESNTRGYQKGGWSMSSEFSNNGDGPKTDATEGSSGSLNVDGLMASASGLVKMAGLKVGKYAEVMGEIKDKVEKIKELQDNNQGKKDERKPATIYKRLGNSWAGKDGTISDRKYHTDVQVDTIHKSKTPNAPDTFYIKDGIQSTKN
jgi:RHS repeat-associated protein